MRLQMLLDPKEKQLRGPHMLLTVGVDTEDVTTVVSLQMVKERKEKRETSRVLHPVAGDAEASVVEEDHEGSTVAASSEVDVAVEDVEAGKITDMMMVAMKEKWKVMVPCEDVDVVAAVAGDQGDTSADTMADPGLSLVI